MKLRYKKTTEKDWELVSDLEKLGFLIEGWKDNYFGNGELRLKLIKKNKE